MICLIEEETSTQSIALATVKDKIKSDPILRQESPRQSTTDTAGIVQRKPKCQQHRGASWTTQGGWSCWIPYQSNVWGNGQSVIWHHASHRHHGEIERCFQCGAGQKDWLICFKACDCHTSTRRKYEKSSPKDCTIAQAVNRLKHERKENYKRVCESKK